MPNQIASILSGWGRVAAARRFKSPGTRFRHVAYIENILGTSLEIQVISADETTGPLAEVALMAEIDRLESVFNGYDASSELSRWQTTFERDVVVSKELSQVLAEAEKWRIATDGAFNPAVESLTRLWKQHASEGLPVNLQEIEPIVAEMNAPLWEVDPDASTARRSTKLTVTLNSIAKGFIIDRACAVAAAMDGVIEVLVNIGGDIRHAGTKAVNIAIADPHDDAENAVPFDRIALLNQGLATSGNYRRGFQIGEKWFSHLLDPRTGWPVEAMVSVSVVAPDACLADVLATAFSVLTPDESIALADSLGEVGVLLIAADGAQHSNSFWKKRSQSKEKAEILVNNKRKAKHIVDFDYPNTRP